MASWFYVSRGWLIDAVGRARTKPKVLMSSSPDAEAGAEPEASYPSAMAYQVLSLDSYE